MGTLYFSHVIYDCQMERETHRHVQFFPAIILKGGIDFTGYLTGSHSA